MNNILIVSLLLVSVYSLHIHQHVELNGKYVETGRKREGNLESVELTYSNPGEYYLKPTSPVHTKVNVEVLQESSSELTLRIRNDVDTFDIPHEFPFPYTKEDSGIPGYFYTLNSDTTLFKLERQDGTTLFELGLDNIISLLYSELHTKKQTDYNWGMGERRLQSFRIPNGEYTTWNYDHMDFDYSKKAGQVYGSHPVILSNINKLYHIMLFRVSRPSTIEITDTEVNFRVTGGQIEFKFIIGKDDPKDLIRRYHRYVNGWALHPFWAAGWHQSRWGYENSQQLKEVVAQYKANNIPIDVIWTDLDYMQDRKDFTLNEALFTRQDMQSISDLSKEDGVHWVPIVDPGIAVDSSCSRKLVKSEAYIRSNKQNKTPLVGVVWPGEVYFTDFNHVNASQVWHECEVEFEQQYEVKPSGIWIDMNELANFVKGEVSDSKTKLNPNVVELSDLPWDAMGSVTLEEHTVSIDGLHSSGVYIKSDTDIPELDLHSFYGFMQSIATKESQSKLHNTNLTFILTRASTYGSGRFVSHWFGDNASTWTWLRTSIAALFNFNIFGIPMSGDDICGFNEDTTPQLCARWIQLGVFYPFARSHNTIGAKSQEPYSLGDYVLQTSQKSIKLRYSLMKYYYALFVQQRDNSIGAGAGTIIDPIFYRYKDIQAVDIDTQFMVGDIVVFPVVTEQVENVEYTDLEYYVPTDAIWYSFETGAKLNKGWNTIRRTFSDIAFMALNAGSIIPWSDSTNVYRSRQIASEINLIVTLDSNNQAIGKYLSLASFDNGNIESRCWNDDYSCIRTVSVTLKKGVLTFINGPTTKDNSEDILIKDIVLYYLGQIKTFKVNVSSFTKQWQITL